MQKEIEKLKEEFERIKNIGWIEEKRHGFTAIGYTFESMLGKDEDDFPLYDYHNIEIKTMNNNTKTNLHLLCVTPDGGFLFPIKRIIEELGCPCKDDKTKKVFYRSFNSIDYTNIIYGRRGKINVNYQESKVELLVYNNKMENTNIGISWSFDILKERLKLKLLYLAVIRASSCIISGKGYYYYDKINFYKMKDFETFLRLIENGIIEIISIWN